MCQFYHIGSLYETEEKQSLTLHNIVLKETKITGSIVRQEINLKNISGNVEENDELSF